MPEYKPPTFDSGLCARCGDCIEVCPQDAILTGEEGFPEVLDDCAACGQCAEVCSTGAMSWGEPE